EVARCDRDAVQVDFGPNRAVAIVVAGGEHVQQFGPFGGCNGISSMCLPTLVGIDRHGIPEVAMMANSSPPRTSKLMSSSRRSFCRLRPHIRRHTGDLSTSYIRSFTTRCGCLANGGGSEPPDANGSESAAYGGE